MKKVILIGATGFVGSHILDELLSRNHIVTAIARNSDKLATKNKNLEIISLDVNDVESLAEIMKDADAVISAFNAGWGNPNIYNDFMKGSYSIESAVINSNIKQYIVVGGAGSLLINGKLVMDSDGFPQEILEGVKGARDYLYHLKDNSKINWTFFSPPIDMFDGERTGKYRLGKDNPVFDDKQKSRLSVQDVAVVLVDELENPKHSKQRFTAGY